MRVGVVFLSLGLVGVAGWGCSGPESVEDEARRRIAEAETLASAGRSEELRELVSVDYEDVDGRDRQRLLKVVEAALATRPSPRISVRVQSLSCSTEEICQVGALVLARRSDAPGSRGTSLWVDAELRRERGELRLATCSWRLPEPRDFTGSRRKDPSP